MFLGTSSVELQREIMLFNSYKHGVLSGANSIVFYKQYSPRCDAAESGVPHETIKEISSKNELKI